MILYVEIKPCYFSTMKMNEEGFFDPLIDCYGVKQFKNRVHNSFQGTLWLTPDYKYAYGHYNGKPEYFRVHNISSKPIIRNKNKVQKWNKLTYEINKLREERRKLVRKEEKYDRRKNFGSY